MASLASINVKFQVDTRQFSTQMQNVAREVEKSGRLLSNIGQQFTLGLSVPLAAVGAAALSVFSDIDALKKGLIAVSGSAAEAEKEFSRLREVAKLPGLGLEEAVKGSVALQSAGFSAAEARRSLLAFGNALATVGKGKRELDLVVLALTQLQNKTSGFGQDLRQLVEQLPQLRGSLTDAFGTADSEAIAKLGVTGKQVVETLVTEFEKLPKVNGGLKNSFENLFDTIKVSLARLGDSINRNLNIEGLTNKIASVLEVMVDAFDNLSPTVQKIILVVAGIATALGPVLLILGGIASALPVIASGFAILTGPIGLVVAGITAIGVAVATYWDEIVRETEIVGQYFAELYNESLFVRQGIESMLFGFKTLFGFLKLSFSNTLVVLGSFVKIAFEQFKNLGLLIKGVLTFDLEDIKRALREGIVDSVKNATAAVKDLKANTNEFKEAVKKDFILALNNIAGRKFVVNVDRGKIASDVASAVKSGIAAGTGVGGGVSGEATPQVTPVNAGLEMQPLVMPVRPQAEEIVKDLEMVDEKLIETQGNAATFAESMQQAVQQGLVNAASGLGQLIAEFSSFDSFFLGFGQLLLRTLATVVRQLGESLIQIGISMIAIKKAFNTLSPGLAIGAGVALIALSSFLQSTFSNAGNNIQGFQDGGIVGGNSYFGDRILARLNSGELILNKKQQQRMFGLLESGSNVPNVVVDVQGVIRGEDLQLIAKKVDKRMTRIS